MAIKARQTWTSHQRHSASISIQQQFIRQFAAEQSRWFVYRATPYEADTELLIRHPGISVYAPVTRHEGDMHWHRVDGATVWQQGRHGIEEPVDGSPWRAEEGAVLVACPLVGFDRRGNRLGMGMGCYDRWLAKHSDSVASLVGLAFSCQELESVPSQAHDVPMDYVITETEIIACGSKNSQGHE